MSKPYVSLCAITHDGGLSTLARMLKSVLDRDGVPAVEEVVIGFNGQDDAAFFAVMSEVVPGFAPTFERRDCALPGNQTIDFVVYKSEWTDDFAAARNELHSKTTGVWHFWLDADDVWVESGDPQILEEARRAKVPENVLLSIANAPKTKKPGGLAEYLRLQEGAGANCIVLPYHYVVDGAGRPLQRQWKPRIIKWDAGWIWKNRVHEDLVPTFGNKFRNAVNALTLVRHAPAEAVQVRLRRNADINRQMAEELKAKGEDIDYRTMFNVGAIAFDDRDWQQAISALSGSAVKAERVGEWMEALVALDLLARAYVITGAVDKAVETGFNMVRINSNRPEGYLALVVAYYAKQAWAACARWFDLSQQISLPPVVAVDNVVERTVWPMCWAAEACGNLGFHDRATELSEKALALAPDDALAQRTADGVRWVREQVEAMLAVKNLVRFHVRNGDLKRAEFTLLAAPAWEEDHFADVRGEIAAARMAPLTIGLHSVTSDGQETWTAALGPSKGVTRDASYSSETLLATARSHGDVLSLDEADGKATVTVRSGDFPYRVGRVIDIYAPIHNEPWRPEHARTQGIGGSEEAIVYLSEELVRRGHTVRVYGPSLQSTRVRVVNGVEWRRFADFVADEKHDVVIGHRAPWLTQNFPNCAELLVWHHDHDYIDDAWNAVTAPKGKHLFVSEFQALMLAEKLPGVAFQGSIIQNAVPAEQVLDVDESKRNPLKVVYASQPIRGLSRLLEIWPEILKDQPEAELHIFYGYHTNRLGAQVSPTVRAELEKVEALLPKAQRVVDHGRVGHLALMDELRTAGVWAYPCNYPETSCITGLRAQAAGCIPVFMTYGNAMLETQPSQAYAINEPWESLGKEQFTARLKIALAEPSLYDRRHWINRVRESYTWTQVAERVEKIVDGESELKAISG